MPKVALTRASHAQVPYPVSSRTAITQEMRDAVIQYAEKFPWKTHEQIRQHFDNVLSRTSISKILLDAQRKPEEGIAAAPSLKTNYTRKKSYEDSLTERCLLRYFKECRNLGEPCTQKLLKLKAVEFSTFNKSAKPLKGSNGFVASFMERFTIVSILIRLTFLYAFNISLFW